MKKKILILAALVIVGILVLGACTSDENLINVGENNTFSYSDLSALQKEWTLKTDDEYSTSDVFSVSDGALVINTSKAGWGQALQKVSLKSNSYYLIEYTFTANSFSSFGDQGYDGFFISILEDDDFNTGDNAVHHRGITSSKTTGRLYFKTTSAKNTTIAINVGTEDYPVSVNSVTISDIKLVQVPKSQITAENATYFTFVSDHYGDASAKNVLWVVLGGVAVALICYAAYVMFQRNMAMEGEYKNKFLAKIRDSKFTGVVLVAAVAFLIRLLIDLLTVCIAGTKTYITLGYNVEGYASQALFIGNYGTVYLGESLAKFCTDNGYTYMAPGSNPILLYILGLVGLISRIFAGSNPYLAAIFFIKFFASLADVATVVLIYIMIKKSAGNVGAAVIATAYAILPVTFGVSALWGFAESITVFLIVLTVFFMLKNNYYGVAITYFVAFLTSWTALIFLPIVIMYSIQQAINRRELRIPMIIAVVVGFALFYLLNLPFDFNQIKEGSAFACVVKYWDMTAKNLRYSLNAFNFQTLLGNNFGIVSTESLIVSVIFIAFMLALVAIGYFKTKNRMNLLLLATAFINMVFMFSNNMTPVVMMTSLALMLIYAVMNKEKRIYFAFAVFAVLTFVNISVGELLYSYTSDAIYQITYDTATAYVFSAFALVAVLYYIYVTYDVVASRKMRKIQPMTLTYLGWWKNLFLRIKKSYYKLRIKTTKQS